METEVKFDLLRARLEGEIPNPAIVAITSSTNEDGRDVAARALASSLAATGYSTMLIIAAAPIKGGVPIPESFALDEIGRREITSPSASKLVLVSIGESVQRTTNQRHIKSAFELFRERFDYVIISAGFEGQSNPFAATVIGVANAVLVSVKQGRRQTRLDTRLSNDLNRLGPRFLGLIAISQAKIEAATAFFAPKPGIPTEAWRTPISPIEKTSGRREVAEWQT